jgi:flagellar basal-body rod protein FlgF
VENAAYIGLSRQMTLRRELDIVANNIANANTTGFKVEQLLVGTEVGARARNDSIKLVTKAGLAVQGDGGDIILDPAKGAPVVGEDGTISQNGALVGRLTLARFDTLAALSKDGDGLYRNRSNATPIDATGAKIRQGALEASNVNPLTEITSMIEISRAYEQATRMIENVNDLSKRAVERLGRPN